MGAKKDWLIIITLAALIAFSVGAITYRAWEQIKCNDRGGVYVRQFAGYTCVVMK